MKISTIFYNFFEVIDIVIVYYYTKKGKQEEIRLKKSVSA